MYRSMKITIAVVIVIMLCGSLSFASSENHITRVPHVKDNWEFKDEYTPILVIKEKDANEFGSENQNFTLSLENAEWCGDEMGVTVADIVYDGVSRSTKGISMNITKHSSKRISVTINRGTALRHEKAYFKIPMYSKVTEAGDVTITIDSDSLVSSGIYKYALAIGKSKNSKYLTVDIGHIFGKDNPIWLGIKESKANEFGPENQTFILTLSNSKWVDEISLNPEESIKNIKIRNVKDARIVSMKKVNDRKLELTLNRGKSDLEWKAQFYLPLYIKVTNSGSVSLNIQSKGNVSFEKEVSLELILDQEGKCVKEKETPMKVYIYINSPNIYTIKNEKKEQIQLDVAPINENGTTLVPIRGVFEALGVRTIWQPESQGILLKNDSMNVQLNIGSSSAYVNGRYIDMPIEPKLINNRTFIPLRFISESFEYDVKWIQEEKKIIITK